MIRSMTGFGKGEHAEGERSCTVQLKSVNNRFLELGLKLPPDLWGYEAQARAILQAGLNRGKVDIHWKEAAPEQAAPAPRVDAARAAAWLASLRGLAAGLGVDASFSLESLVRLPGVLASPESQGAAEPGTDAEARWACLRRALEGAVEDLNASRNGEGAALAAELGSLLGQSEACVDAIEKKSIELQQGFAERLRKRIAQLLETIGPDDPRLLMEAALAADKADIREELVRFRAHTVEFRRLLGAETSPGKRMDFLCQELLREANTMGSKSPEAGLTQAVVGLKSVVERLKEQVQNVE